MSPQNAAKRSKVQGTVYPMPSLASLFRERVKALLTFSGATQTALAVAMARDRAKVSRLLASDEEAAIVTVEQLEQVARFFDIPPANLFLQRDEALMALTHDESDLVEMYRQLPPEQRENMLSFLRFTMEPRQRASSERREIAKLKAALQRQRDTAHSRD